MAAGIECPKCHSENVNITDRAIRCMNPECGYVVLVELTQRGSPQDVEPSLDARC
jgi:DNA-directed RNA polymerase subunit RPC12/RpoP